MSVSPSSPRLPSWRWLVVLAASVLAHLLVLGWAGGSLPAAGRDDDTATEPLSVALLSPAPPTAAPQPAPPPPKPKAKPKNKAQPQPRPLPAATSEPQQGLPAPATAGPDTAVVEAAGNAGPGVSPLTTDGSADTTEPSPVEPVPWNADTPPPAELEYVVNAQRDGGSWHGTGRFRWWTDGERYRVSGEASVTILFRITVLNFQSEGRINPEGIIPERYSETPWRKDTALAWFDRQAGKISFSSSAATSPLEGGEQDRASVIWQLAALGRGDGTRFTPGGELEIVVAGARSADRWRFRMVGMEEVETPHGRHAAWHLQRAPRGGRRDQGIDIWLAPGLDWYPVRVRHNYTNGEFLDMSLSELHGTAPAADK